MVALHLGEQGKGLSLQTFLNNCPRGLGVSGRPGLGLGRSTALSRAGTCSGDGGGPGRWWQCIAGDESICADSLRS